MAKLPCGITTLLLLLLFSVAFSVASSSSSFDGITASGRVDGSRSGLYSPQPWRTCGMGDCDDNGDIPARRVLAGTYSYISYGALTANRVPCPPQSGRSYYSANCNSATGTANPYSRSCSAITRCQRSTA